ncbi:MAG: hypothetical protein MUP98_11065 [Candidatus Aminicenantes bacterium]|nr:hypothetical protein [Candidatus Aminicenantes bacterium]
MIKMKKRKKSLIKVMRDKRHGSYSTELFTKSLSLWKNADPGLPEVEDAKMRLVGLRRE